MAEDRPRSLGRGKETGAADGHDLDVTRPRTVSAIRSRVLLPTASGAQCARALRRSGFDLRPAGPDHVVAERDGVPVVTIPLADRLRPELLVAILRTAGVSAVEFVENLDDE